MSDIATEIVLIRATDPNQHMSRQAAEMIYQQALAVLGEDTKVAVLPYELQMKKAESTLDPETAENARSLLTGTTTSTVMQVWGCGHEIVSVNGESLYATCPICFTKREEV